ncbi:MAG: acetyltransferase, partial [Ginsengibacter sp.]
MAIYCIYGASGHSKVIIEILEGSGSSVRELFDDDQNKTRLLDFNVTRNKEILKLPGVNWIIGVGNNRIRKKIADHNRLDYANAIDVSAKISKRIKIGKGTVIMPGVCIN